MSKLLNKAKGFVARNYAYTWLMGMAAAAVVCLMPTMAAAANDANGVLQAVGNLGAIVVAVIAVIIVIMEAPKIAKGEKAVGGTIVKVLCLLLFAGLILVLTNINTLGSTFSTLGSNLVDFAETEADNIIS